jgi:predicted HTH domain antitoxin
LGVAAFGYSQQLGGGGFLIGRLKSTPLQRLCQKAGGVLTWPGGGVSSGILASKRDKVNQKMRAAQISFEISESILQALNQSQDEFISQMRLFTALQLFKNHKLSFGQAAELAGMSKERFLIELDNYNIDLIDYDASELEKEMKRFQT